MTPPARARECITALCWAASVRIGSLRGCFQGLVMVFRRAGDWAVLLKKAMARSVEDRLEEEAQRLPLRKEGLNEGRWALLDYGELIVHILQSQERSYYDLEAFWSHGERRPHLASETSLGL